MKQHTARSPVLKVHAHVRGQVERNVQSATTEDIVRIKRTTTHRHTREKGTRKTRAEK